MFRQITLLVITLIAVTTRSSALQCIECDSYITNSYAEVDGDLGCAAGTAPNRTGSSALQTCFVNYQYSADKRHITRGGGNVSTPTSLCSSSGNVYTCYCNTTDSCNNQPVDISKSLQCYECESVEFFDNGCGATVNETSGYVTKVSDCSACSKVVSVYLRSNGFVKHYTRGCVKAVNYDTGCHLALGATTAGSETCSCDTALCNSAQSIQHVAQWSFFVAALSALRSAF